MTTVDTKWPRLSTANKCVRNFIQFYILPLFFIMHLTNKTRHYFLTIYVYTFINGFYTNLQLTISNFYRFLKTRTQLCLKCNHLYGKMNRSGFSISLKIVALILSIAIMNLCNFVSIAFQILSFYQFSIVGVGVVCEFIF